jgi:hypothetical protein
LFAAYVLQALSRRGCHGSALEATKLLLALDPEDPMGALLLLDYLALRAGGFRVYVGGWVESVGFTWAAGFRVEVLGGWLCVRAEWDMDVQHLCCGERAAEQTAFASLAQLACCAMHGT